jgi:hypothetical protein
MPVDSDLAASRDRLKAANVSVAVDMQGKAKILVGATKVQLLRDERARTNGVPRTQDEARMHDGV